jgi:hypothetical protein
VSRARFRNRSWTRRRLKTAWTVEHREKAGKCRQKGEVVPSFGPASTTPLIWVYWAARETGSLRTSHRRLMFGTDKLEGAVRRACSKLFSGELGGQPALEDSAVNHTRQRAAVHAVPHGQPSGDGNLMILCSSGDLNGLDSWCRPGPLRHQQCARRRVVQRDRAGDPDLFDPAQFRSDAIRGMVLVPVRGVARWRSQSVCSGRCFVGATQQEAPRQPRAVIDTTVKRFLSLSAAP